MNSTVKAGFTLILGSLVVFLAIKFLSAIIWFLLPVAGIAGVALVIYGMTGGKRSLSDGRRNLP